MEDHRLGRAPDYTNAFWTMAYVWMMIVLIAIWAIWGYGAALGVAFAVHIWILQRIEKKRQSSS